ncbi:MAG TPA: hypothetical protein VF659_17490 [Pyrinomonadaceae bacterium]|jgi:hypothetical protein
MVQPQDPPIVVSGGSVTLEFDTGQLTPEGNGKHGNPDKTLKRITIKGDGIDITQNFPTGKGVVIRIFYGNGNNP